MLLILSESRSKEQKKTRQHCFPKMQIQREARGVGTPASIVGPLPPPPPPQSKERGARCVRPLCWCTYAAAPHQTRGALLSRLGSIYRTRRRRCCRRRRSIASRPLRCGSVLVRRPRPPRRAQRASASPATPSPAFSPQPPPPTPTPHHRHGYMRIGVQLRVLASSKM